MVSAVLKAILTLGILGLVVGGLLAAASHFFAVRTDERVEKITVRATDVFADAKVKADAYLERKKAECGEDCCCSRGQED